MMDIVSILCKKETKVRVRLIKGLGEDSGRLVYEIRHAYHLVLRTDGFLMQSEALSLTVWF